jgi:hypothetical protein
MRSGVAQKIQPGLEKYESCIVAACSRTAWVQVQQWVLASRTNRASGAICSISLRLLPFAFRHPPNMEESVKLSKNRLGILLVGVVAITACGGSDTTSGAGGDSSTGGADTSGAGASTTPGTAGSTTDPNPGGVAGAPQVTAGAPGTAGAMAGGGRNGGGGAQGVGGALGNLPACPGMPMDGDPCTAAAAGAGGRGGTNLACSSGATMVCTCRNATYRCFDVTFGGAGRNGGGGTGGRNGGGGTGGRNGGGGAGGRRGGGGGAGGARTGGAGGTANGGSGG